MARRETCLYLAPRRRAVPVSVGVAHARSRLLARPGRLDVVAEDQAGVAATGGGTANDVHALGLFFLTSIYASWAPD